MNRDTKDYEKLLKQTTDNLRELQQWMEREKAKAAPAVNAPVMTGSDLKRLMKKEHLSLRTLAAKIDVSLGAIRYWLKQSRHPIPKKHYPILHSIMTPAKTTKQSKSA